MFFKKNVLKSSLLALLNVFNAVGIELGKMMNIHFGFISLYVSCLGWLRAIRLPITMQLR